VLKRGDTITLINVATNQPRCKITKTASGNPEKLAPDTKFRRGRLKLRTDRETDLAGHHALFPG
jgi:hypothetical protein